VSVEGSYHDPKKVVVVEGFLIPKFVTNVRAFLRPQGITKDSPLGMPRLQSRCLA